MILQKKITASLISAVILLSSPLTFAATTISSVITQPNVITGSDMTQSAIGLLTTPNKPIGADTTQLISLSTTQANIEEGLDNTQSLSLVGTVANGTGTVQSDRLTLSGSYDVTDAVTFNESFLGTISSSLGLNTNADILNSLVLNIKASPNYIASAFTVDYDSTLNAMIITGKSVGFDITYTTNVIDGGAPSVILSTITNVQLPTYMVAQVSTATVSGTIESGDTFNVNLDGLGNFVSYTASSNLVTTGDVAGSLVTSITNYVNYGTLPYTVALNGSDIVFTAKVAGTGFTVSTSSSNKVAVKMVQEATVSGVVETGDKYEITFTSGTGTLTGSYTALDTDTLSVVASKLSDSINSLVTGDELFIVTSSSDKVVFTAKTAGVSFIIDSVNTVNSLAISQVETVTIGGVVETGDVFNIEIPNVPLKTYVAVNGDTVNSVVTAINGLIQSDASYASAGFTTTVLNNVITITAKVAGSGFTVTSNALNRSSISQVNTLSFSSVTAGDTVVIDIDGVIYNYLIQTGNTSNDVVSALITMINGDSNSPVIASGTSTLVLTSKVAGTTFSASGSIVTTGNVNKTVTFKSGWSVFSTPQTLSAISFSNGNAAGLSFYKLEGGVWSETTIAPTVGNIKPLEGFLVFNSNVGSVQTYLTFATITNPAQKVFQKNLTSGWNILGVTTTVSPFSTIGSSATAGIDFTNGTSKLNSVDSTYVNTTGNASLSNVQDGEAYGVFMSNSGIYGGSQQ